METVGAFQENCYLLTDDRAGVCVLIDPGSEPDRLIAAVEDTGAEPQAIWVTHGHLDHVGAIAGLARRWKLPIHLHPLDQPLYAAASRQAAAYGLSMEQPPAADRSLGDGDVLELGRFRFTVMHAPGHAPGHIVIHGHGLAFVGDCLFAGSIGRTDLPLERIVTLPEETVVYPGHGPATTIGREMRSNPFLTGVARIVGA